MTHHTAEGTAGPRRQARGALVAAMFLCLMGGSAAADMDFKEIDVDISPGHTKETNVGCGFGLITKPTWLQVELCWPIPTPVADSGCDERAPNPQEHVWVQMDKNIWWCLGIEPNMEFWVVLWGVKGGGRPGGGGGRRMEGWMSVSDCDLDADTDNLNSVGWPREPDETDDEDYVEYYDTPYAPSTVPGIVLGVNDDHDEFLPGADPWGRDLDNDTADLLKEGQNYKEDGDTGHSVGLAKLQLTVNAKRDGQLDFDFFPTVSRLFESDGSPFQGARNLGRGSHELTFWMECVHGGENVVTTIFNPVGAPGVAIDKISVTSVPMDIDVDSDNNGTPGDSDTEDLNEAKPGEPGMVVSLTEDPEEPPGGEGEPGPNGILRGIYSPEIVELLDPHEPVVTLKKVTGEGGVRVWKVRDGADPVKILDTSEKKSTTEDGEGGTLWNLLKDCDDHDIIITGIEVGEVQLGLELTVKGATKTKVAMDVVRITVLEMESTEWLVTHDPEFEHLYCQTPGDQGHPEWAGRFKQAVLMDNEALVKATKITGVDYKVKLCCNDVDVVTLDKTSTRYQEQDGFCIFHFETDEDQNNGADTDADGRIFVEATPLTQGITQTGVKYTFELWANQSKVCTREVTIKPLIDRLATPYSPWRPTNLFTAGFSPYTRPDYTDHRWEDTPVREMDAEDGDGGNHLWYFNRAYGMAIVCEFTDELNNLTVKASGGDINGERTYAVADAATYLQADTDRTIEWEGFDDDSEKIHDVANLSGLGTPLATPKVIRESEEYVLKISAKRKKDTTQEQSLELRQIKVDYQLEHTFTEVTP